MTRNSGRDGWEDAEVPEHEAVRERLVQLGVPLDVLLHAIRAGQEAFDFCTTAHPVYYPGLRANGETNGELRGGLALRAWTFNDDQCIPRVISPDGSVVITAVSGDPQTGLRDGPDAQTRYPRGAAGVRIVRRNAQLVLEGFDLDDDHGKEEPLNLGPTWFLLYNRDGDKVRSELSLASDVSEAGALLVWSERLILPEIDMLNQPPRSTDSGDESGPLVDVPVERRAG